MFQKESPRERRYLGAVVHAPYVPLRSTRSESAVTLEHTPTGADISAVKKHPG